MKKIYNFSAGPAVLNAEVLKSSAQAAIEFKGTGMGLMEMSHRSKPVVEMFNETEQLLRELMEIPDNYKVLFLQGGASLQFLMVPMNLLNPEDVVDYADTGAWSAKAIKEAKSLAKVNVVCSSKETTYDHIPKDLNQDPNAKYLHITSNNTIYGTQWNEFPTPINPEGYLVADMSSDILCKPIDVKKFGIIYAGAQKNIGPSGVTVVIIREDILGKVKHKIPTMLDYKTHIENESMFNTPPVFSVYVANQTFHWLKNLGGLKAIEVINHRKAAKLYSEIERNSIFQCQWQSKIARS
jgi:phosphoserine aminotransferase